jgi:hypothetical protein
MRGSEAVEGVEASTQQQRFIWNMVIKNRWFSEA